MNNTNQQQDKKYCSSVDSDLKRQLSELKIKKGKVSRQIGIAKNKSENYSHLIEKMKKYSNSIRELQDHIKAQNKRKTSENNALDYILLKKPPQFDEKKLIHSSSGLTVSVCFDFDYGQ